MWPCWRKHVTVCVCVLEGKTFKVSRVQLSHAALFFFLLSKGLNIELLAPSPALGLLACSHAPCMRME